MRIGILVCEDVWEPEPARAARDAGAELLIVVNASPYEQGKQREREQVLRERVADIALPVVYVNLVGGQDELVFDGGSFVLDAQGGMVLRAPAFEEALSLIEVTRRAGHIEPRALRGCRPVAAEPGPEDSVYRALVLGVRDYVNKHRFPGRRSWACPAASIRR